MKSWRKRLGYCEKEWEWKPTLDLGKISKLIAFKQAWAGDGGEEHSSVERNAYRYLKREIIVSFPGITAGRREWCKTMLER